jgi:hypothetical protein
MLRILPYRTMENKIDGAVITVLPFSLREAQRSISVVAEDRKD